MEDYEVRDVRRRDLAPDLRLVFKLGDGTPVRLTFQPDASWSVEVPLRIAIENLADAVAEVGAFSVYVDARVKLIRMRELGRAEHWMDFRTERVRMNQLTASWTRNRLPIWKDMRVYLGNTPLAVAFPHEAGDFLVYWDARTPHANIHIGRLMFQSDGTAMTLIEGELVDLGGV